MSLLDLFENWAFNFVLETCLVITIVCLSVALYYAYGQIGKLEGQAAGQRNFIHLRTL